MLRKIAIRLLSVPCMVLAAVVIATGAMLLALAGWLNSYDIGD